MKTNTRLLCVLAVIASFSVISPTFVHAESRITVLGSAKGDTTLGVARMDVIKTEFAKQGVTDFKELVVPTIHQVDVTFVEFSSESAQATSLDISKVLFKEGFRPATAGEAASFDEVPFLAGKAVTCIGTMLPINENTFLTLGFKYSSAELATKKGVEMLFLLSKHDGWKGKLIIPVVKIDKQ